MNYSISKNTFGKAFALLLLGGGMANSGIAQTIFYNNGAQIYTGSAAIVQVNGGLQNDGATAVLENNGTMTIANSGTPGSVFLTNGSVMQGNGTYKVEQNWQNDATFTGGNSTVELNGNTQQFITSTTSTVTTFNNLVLTGTGTGANRKKTLQAVGANTGTNGVLTINDRELETATNTMSVQNPAVTAVTNATTFGAEGFVSSDPGGALARATNSTSTYSFPTGSSLGTLRYREVRLTPASTAANTFNARLGNNNATADGFNTLMIDSTLCKVTSLFYHQVTRSAGTDNANIDIFYDQAADGPWDGLAQFDVTSATLWNNMGTVTATTATPYNNNLKVNWADFTTNHPFILARKELAEPAFACADVCANSTGNVFTATGAPAGSTFHWTTPAGTTITSGASTDQIDVTWGTTGGPVTVYVTDAVGCFSDPVSCTVNVNAVPVAAFDTASSGFNYTFSNLTTGPVTSWAWDFGDGSSSSMQSPMHTYGSNGLQTVCLTADNNGCTDTECMVIDVDVFEFINIPNVFTPDGDGTNDFFFINNSGMKEFQLDIYNRWGTKVFSSSDAAVN